MWECFDFSFVIVELIHNKAESNWLQNQLLLYLNFQLDHTSILWTREFIYGYQDWFSLWIGLWTNADSVLSVFMGFRNNLDHSSDSHIPHFSRWYLFVIQILLFNPQVQIIPQTLYGHVSLLIVFGKISLLGHWSVGNITYAWTLSVSSVVLGTICIVFNGLSKAYIIFRRWSLFDWTELTAIRY